MSRPNRICLIDDDASARKALERVLVDEGHEVASFSEGTSGLGAIRENEFDCVLTDLRMPGVSGLDLIEHLRHESPHLPVVLMTAHSTTEVAIEATRRGAFDYIVKPFEMEELLGIVGRAATAGRRRHENVSGGGPASHEIAFIGQSRAMQAVYKEIGRVAEKNVSVVIVGETGTGKELVARALWQHGARRAKSFVAVNCAAVPENLLESELFGHERGAFTGADARRIGRFEQANGGVLFLDEIADLSFPMQAKLLRVLQERVISRVGGRDPIPVDVRIVAATHGDLPAMVAAGKFREDLWYRLNVVVIALPPLRERREDIPSLVEHFVARHSGELGGVAGINPGAMEFLRAQPWPGNARQLENVVKRILLLAHGYGVTEELVRIALAPAAATVAGVDFVARPLNVLCAEALSQARVSQVGAVNALLGRVERELLAQAVAATRGNITQMAQLLGWSRLTVREKLKVYGLSAADGGEKNSATGGR